ncbi:MAG: hypothetical protein ACRC2N_15360, partial [Aeromonas sp.]
MVIFDWYSKAYNWPLPPDAELAIFGFSQRTSCHPRTIQQSLTLGMIVAKRRAEELEVTLTPFLSHL